MPLILSLHPCLHLETNFGFLCQIMSLLLLSPCPLFFSLFLFPPISNMTGEQLGMLFGLARKLNSLVWEVSPCEMQLSFIANKGGFSKQNLSLTFPFPFQRLRTAFQRNSSADGSGLMSPLGLHIYTYSNKGGHRIVEILERVGLRKLTKAHKVPSRWTDCLNVLKCR